jgi:hypothetical protein
VRLVVPRATLELEHPAYLLRPSAAGLAAAATSSLVTLLDPRLSRPVTLQAAGAIEDVALAPGGKLAALIDDEGLRLLDVQKDSLRWRIVGKSYACHFTASGEQLWVARPSAQSPGAWLELRDVANGGTLHKLHLPDPFGGSAFTLAPHADPRGIVVWIASPDLATRSLSVVAGASLAAEELPHHDGYPPEPIPDCGDYLLVQAGVLERRRWSDHGVRDEMYWPWLDDEDLAVLALSPARALWASRTGRLHLLDHAEMSYLEEVAVSTRPPRPLVESFPDTDDPRWGTDLQQLCVVGSHVILQFGDTRLVSLDISDLH